MNDLSHKTPKTTVTSAQQNEASPTVSSSRRRLLKQASMAAPAMLTLRSGAAMAMNSCERVNQRIAVIEDKIDKACKVKKAKDEDGNKIEVVKDEDDCSAALSSLNQANASLGSHYCIN